MVVLWVGSLNTIPTFFCMFVPDWRAQRAYNDFLWHSYLTWFGQSDQLCFQLPLYHSSTWGLRPWSVITKHYRLNALIPKIQMLKCQAPVWWCLEVQLFGVLWICQINNRLNGAQGAGWWAVFQQQITRETEIEEFINHRSWKSIWNTLRGHQVKSRQSTDREIGPSYMACEGLWVEPFGADF